MENAFPCHIPLKKKLFSYRNLYLDVSENKGYPDTPNYDDFNGEVMIYHRILGYPIVRETNLLYWTRLDVGTWNMKMHLFPSKSPSGLAFYAKFLGILRTYQHGHGKTHGTA